MHGQQQQNQNNQNYNQGGTGSKVAKTMNATIVTGEYFSQKEQRQKAIAHQSPQVGSV